MSASLFAAEWGFKKIFGVSLILVLCLVVFGNAAYSAYQQGSVEPFLLQLGSVSFLTLQHISQQSMHIINGETVPLSFTFSGFWAFTSFYADFFLSLTIIVTWINILKKILKISNNDIFNYGLATLVYLVVEIGLVLAIAAYYHQLNDFASFMAYAMLPINAIGLAFRAIWTSLGPITGKVVAYTNHSLNTTQLPEILQH